MLFTWWLTSVFFYVAYVIRSPTSAVDVIEKHDSQDRQGGAAADDVLRPYYNNAADVLFTSSTSSSSSSGYHVIRDRFLPNGVRVFGIFGRRDCVLSCVLPCTAADFDERRAGGSCWHHYHQHGCSALTVYRPGTTHSRNVVCNRPPHSRRNVDDKRYGERSHRVWFSFKGRSVKKSWSPTSPVVSLFNIFSISGGSQKFWWGDDFFRRCKCRHQA